MKPRYIKRIRDQRQDHDLTQKQIAVVLQTTRQVYSRCENGANEMPIRHLIALAHFYRVSTDYLLGESDDPRRRQR